ncbi:MAG: ribonuclease J [Parcubacteria group bacterium]|nr:ribonuclease J [Parcubacteria group bacterium]
MIKRYQHKRGERGNIHSRPPTRGAHVGLTHRPSMGTRRGNIHEQRQKTQPDLKDVLRAAGIPPMQKKDGSKFARRTSDGHHQRGKGRPASSRHRRLGGRGHHPSPFKSAAPAKEGYIPPVKDGDIRIIPLGGVEEVGRNMTVIETAEDIIVVDCGIQFKEEETPGIDYILPNTKYLEARKEKVRALIITHGHLDHIGGIPYIAPRINNPPIYTRNLTALMIKKRQEEFPHLPPLDLKVIEKEDIIKAGKLRVKFFSVTHTIPDSMGLIIETPYGSIVHTGDLKLDHINGIPTEHEEEQFAQFKKETVLLLMADSTNVERPGFSIPESTVHKNLEEIIKNATGRLFIGTFASQIERIVHIIHAAEKYKKKVVIDGRSMKTNVEIARLAGIFTTHKDTMIPIEEMGDYPPDKIVALVTGAQGDEYAVLMRIANKSHRHLVLNGRDTVVLSSSIVPGNERGVQKLKDNLSRQGARIIHYQVSDIHSSGHANADETLWIHQKIRPKFFIPVHGYHYMLRVHTDIAMRAGMPENHIVIPDNSMVIDIENKGEKITPRKEAAPKGLVMVDGFTVGDMQEVVLRDRQMLAQDGIFMVVVTIDVNTGKLRKSPDLISRGFVYIRESQDMFKDVREVVRKTVEKNIVGMHPINFDYLKGVVTDEVSRYLFQKTNKRPIVIPVVLGV